MTMLCDTGACKTVLNQKPKSLKYSSDTLIVKSASGHTSVKSLTEELLLVHKESGRSCKNQCIYDPSCPINLLGRDALEKLKIGVVPGLEGMYAKLMLHEEQSPEARQLNVCKGQGEPHYYWTLDLPPLEPLQRADPVVVKTTTTYRPVKPQYPLTTEAKAGIKPVIADMEKAGILIKTTEVTCNTPIFPVKKANTGKYRLVHDLRAINEVTAQIPPVVANPHTILNQVIPKEQWFSVIDLSNAFFSVPLHPDSQHLFGFTFEGQKYTYTRLPQGFQNSPTLYAEALKRSMSLCTLPAPGQFLLYVDDILITGNTLADCKANTMTVLHHLAEQGHKVSQHKLQLWSQKVTYLGHTHSLGKGKHC
uniref:ribonuclease H n=1 Tax=Oreochromis aureus TaxID=47969 RepID=A0AAZ1XFP3_OREAU